MHVDNAGLALDDVRAGMVLADDLLDADRRVLLPRGSSLTESALASLRRRGIKTLPIEASGAAPPDRAAQEQMQRLRLDRLFRKYGSADEDRFLRALLTTHRIGGTQ